MTEQCVPACFVLAHVPTPTELLGSCEGMRVHVKHFRVLHGWIQAAEPWFCETEGNIDTDMSAAGNGLLLLCIL